MAPRFADNEDRLLLRLEGDGHGFLPIVDQADAADCGGGEDGGRAAVLGLGLVVERDVARDDREVERAAGFGHAFDAADELAHDFGRWGLPKFMQSVAASGRAPTAQRLRYASAIACLPPS